ncbi:MAG TPA: response regulator [Terrimicrobiaceae bacterium]|nr:response regulator [Terrimicrobiaceae bacterium]
MRPGILIVDDEPYVRLTYRTALETEGLDVWEASDGLAALKAMSERQFDLAILDMRMPEVSGLELLERMRRQRIQTPVVIVTAYGDIPHAVRAMKLGAIDFLEKPLTPDTLRAMVTEILRRHGKHAAARGTPETFEDHVQTAKRLLNLRQFVEAREHIARALEIRSDSPEVFNLGGVLFEMLEDYDRAKRYYGQAIRLNRNYEPAQQNMRRIYELFQFGSSREPFNLGDN